MIHEKYQRLTTIEKIEFTGKLLHAVMYKEKYFHVGMAIIEAAEKDGLFNNVEILPERKERSSLLEELGAALKPNFDI